MMGWVFAETFVPWWLRVRIPSVRHAPDSVLEPHLAEVDQQPQPHPRQLQLGEQLLGMNRSQPLH